MLKPIKDSIIFAFDETIQGGRFIEQTESGIYLGKDTYRDANAPRWGKVLAAGPDVTSISIGDRILIEASMWTFGMEYDGVKIWRTSESKVIGIEK